MKKPLHFLLLALLVSFGYTAQQTIKVSDQAKMTFNRYDQTFLLIDDSLGYYTYSLAKKVWERHPMQVADLTMDFKTFLGRFYPLAVNKNQYYFVLDGCGLVYELRNGKLYRIDQSYDHKNQYFAAMYEYQKRVYMFGGYGMFRVKNTHSYYEPINKEWFEVERRSKEIPSERTSAFHIKQKNNLYILGGIVQRYNKSYKLDDIWHYNLKTRKWQQLGELSPVLNKQLTLRGHVPNKDYSLFTLDDKLHIVYPEKNKFDTYSSSNYLNINRLVPSSDQRYLMIARHNSNFPNTLYVTVKPKKEMLFGIPKENYIYKPISIFKKVPMDRYLWISMIINIVLLVLLFYVNRWKRAAWYKPKNPVLIKSEFTEIEWDILLLIRERGDLELSALNNFFDNEGLSYETLKKRRESFLKALRIKLALITRRDVEGLLPESKHPLDKRMKVIKWNDELSLLDNNSGN